jgi:hypothetical protein
VMWSGAALISLGFHSAAIRAGQLDKEALGIRGLNGHLRIVANMRIRSEISRAAEMVLLVLVGVIAFLAPGRGWGGWALLPLPFLSLISSLLDLRDRRRLEQLDDRRLHHGTDA